MPNARSHVHGRCMFFLVATSALYFSSKCSVLEGTRSPSMEDQEERGVVFIGGKAVHTSITKKSVLFP